MKSDRSRSRTLRVDYLARVEGEGGLHVRMKGDQVSTVQRRVIIFGIEGATFVVGKGVSSAAERGIEKAMAAITEELENLEET